MSLLSRIPTSSFLMSSLLANGAKLGMDRKGWEAIYRKTVGLAERHNLVPKGTAGTWSIVGVLFFLGALLEWNMGQETLGASIIREVATDGASALSKIALDEQSQQVLSPIAQPPAAAEDPALIKAVVTWLTTLPEVQRRSVAARIRRLKTSELNSLLQLDASERLVFLDLVAPEREPTNLGCTVANAINGASDFLWPLGARRQS